MFASPVAGSSFVFCGIAVHAGPEIFSPFWIFVLPKILIVAVSIRHFADFVPLFGQHHKFFLRSGRGLLGLVDTSKSFSPEFYFARG